MKMSWAQIYFLVGSMYWAHSIQDKDISLVIGTTFFILSTVFFIYEIKKSYEN